MAAIPRILAFGVALTLALAGCGEPFAYQGRWIGSREVAGRPGADPDILRQLGRIEVEVKPDGHFTAYAGGLPRSGEVMVEGGRARLKTDRRLRFAVTASGDTAAEFTLEPVDASTVRFVAPGEDPVLLHREPQPQAADHR